MFNSELFVKIRAVVLMTILTLIIPIPLILTWMYQVYDLCINFKKFKNISGEVAVVTGAGNGLGRNIALQLSKRGCKVAVVDIDLKGAEETVEIIKSKYNTECKAYKVDISNYDQVAELNKNVAKDLGAATILINNAGILLLSSYAKPDPKEIQRLINVNLVAHFWTNEVFLENMKQEQKGHIVAVCSIAGMIPLVYNEPYVASKFGVRGMMRTLRLDLQAHGYKDIKTTTICPTFLQTNSKVVHYSNVAGVGNYYPLVKGEEAAKKIVHSMLRNEVEVSIPRIFGIFSRVFDAFPAEIQDKLYFLIAKSTISGFRSIYKEHEELAKNK